MDYQIINKDNFPLAEITLQSGESVRIESGAMIYRSHNVQLSGHMNTKDGQGGLGGLLKAAGRAMTSGESFFITQAVANGGAGTLAIAPSAPGSIFELPLGVNQYRLNTGAFLAMDTTANYQMERQSLSRAVFGGQGGLFVMSTTGQGTMLVNSYGSVRKISLANEAFVADNNHVVAWSSTLEYKISLEGGSFGQSIGTGEGLVNTFHGTGEIYIQTLNIETFAKHLIPFLPSSGDGGGNKGSILNIF